MPKYRIIDIDEVGPVLFERSKRSKNLNIFVRPDDGVRVAIPYGISFKEAEEEIRSNKEWVRKQLARMEKEAREYDPELDLEAYIDVGAAMEALARRVRELAEKHGYVYKKVLIRENRSQWGSCSAKNTISLNAKLMMLPEELRDYVIMHELAHTRHKSHGKGFWKELDRYFGDAKAVDARLRKYILDWM
ncbi:M48 family metallopeptidase [Candidatus Omnitrophota bacterium]